MALRQISGFISQLLFRNILTKLLCLVLSFILFVYVNTSENLERTFTLPISVANRPATLLITSKSESDAEVIVYGPRAKMDHLKASDLALTLFLQDRHLPGTIRFHLAPEQIQVPPGIRVRSIEPSSINLRLESIVAKSCKIQPMLQGSPKEGYEVVEVQVSQQELDVAGPPSVLSQLSSIETEPIDVEAMSGSFKQRVSFRIPNMISLSQNQSVIVAVTIREKIVQRTLESVTIRPTTFPETTRLNPETVSVELEGPYSLIQSMTPERLELFIQDDKLQPGQTAEFVVKAQELPPKITAHFLPPKVTAERLEVTPTPAP